MQVNRLFLRLFIPLVLILSVVAYSAYYYDQKNIYQKTLNETQNTTIHQVQEIQSTFNNIISDIKIMSEQNVLLSFLENPTEDSQTNLASQYLTFSRYRKIYDQIRFIGLDGWEVIRINQGKDFPSIVTDDKLTHKGGRYYFNGTLAAPRGSVYISPFDLNLERNQIEYPIKPIIRFGIPVYDRHDTKKGIVILNYMGNQLISQFKSAAINIPGEFSLINRDGYWLSSSSPELEWGFMFPDRDDITFAAFYPEEWQQINSEDSGQFETEQGLFTFSTVTLYEESQAAFGRDALNTEPINVDYRWKVVSFVPRGSQYFESSSLKLEITIFYALSILIIFYVSRYLVLVNQRSEVSDQALDSKNKELVHLQTVLFKHDKMASLGRSAERIMRELVKPIDSALFNFDNASRGWGELSASDVAAAHSSLSDNENIIRGYDLAYRDLQGMAFLLESYNRIFSDRLTERFRTFNIKELLQDVLKFLDHDIDESNVEISISCHGNDKLTGIPSSFHQLFSNLIKYCIKRTKNTPARIIEIEMISKNNGFLEINLKNNSACNDYEEIESALSGHFPTRLKEGEVALSLSLCFFIVTKELNGEISYENHQDLGITFKILCPVALAGLET